MSELTPLYLELEERLSALTAMRHRYLYDQLPWESQMFGIVGPRGVGKTTMLLQRYRDACSPDDSLYISMDSLYFRDHNLLDTARQFLIEGGRRLFIDEVHKYPDWSQELKLINDILPRLKVCFTGSSILDLARGNADLSRRAPLHHLAGLSFREFLAFKLGIETPPMTLEEVLGHQVAVEGLESPVKHFKDYLRRGCYPFYDASDFGIRLEQAVNLTLEVDIPQFTNIKVGTSRKLKRLLAIVAASAPFKPNASKISQVLGTSRASFETYMGYLDRTGLVNQLEEEAKTLDSVGRVEKVYLDNPNLAYVLAGQNANLGTIRETFFFNQTRVGYEVTASKRADFAICGRTFEVGGRSKKQTQIQGLPDAYLVKDDLEAGARNVIPLWHFGLLY